MGPVDGTDKLTLTPRAGAQAQRTAFSLSALEVSGAVQLRDHASQPGTAQAGGSCGACSSHPAEQTSNRAGLCFSLLAYGLKIDLSALPSMDNGIN